MHGYIDLFDINSTKAEGDALLPCHNDVVCYPEWKKHSEAVALVIMQVGDKQGSCSGALLNNTAQDKKPYFLSAFHCIDIDEGSAGYLTAAEKQRAENWTFRFNFQRKTCNGTANESSYTFNSAYFRSAWQETDFALVELRASLSNPPMPVSYLGWDRGLANPLEGTGIHHPKSNVKKYPLTVKEFSQMQARTLGVTEQ